MCGRIVVTRPLDVLAAYFGASEVVAADRPPSWNVAPGAEIPAVAGTRKGRRLGTMRWGLVPSWSTDPDAGPRPTNARVEGIVDKAVFRLVKAATPGSYTFILPATREVPRRLLHPRKKTVGVRIPEHPVVRALLAELGEPLLSSTLILPGDDAPMTQGWDIKERLDHAVDAVIDSGECGTSRVAGRMNV